MGKKNVTTVPLGAVMLAGWNVNVLSKATSIYRHGKRRAGAAMGNVH